MENRQLGITGFTVSSIGMGCVTFGREIDEQTSFEVLDRAVDRGINLFDSAAAYAAGASESVLGRWMADRGCRDRIVLATKVNGTLTRNHILRSAEDSLKRLRTDRIDLFQLHHWVEDAPLDEALGALNDLVAAGKVRSIGCSNWRAWQLAKALIHAAHDGGQAIQSIQPPYNLAQRDIEADLLPLCADRNIGVISYSPLAAGFLSGKYRRGQDIPKGSRFDVIPEHQPIYFTDHGYEVLEKLETLAHETGRSMIQLALAWALTRTNVTSVLIGARNVAQVDQAFDALEMSLPDGAFERFGT
ncbi:MAG: aryl-alcohol dehydrogenase-like predicted oxidoreductase [Candidatus Binatia bacterium]|jgi:aryl-alcohol dehydrogenase-like predicted oxidoreductase